jgi:predicted CXXCH cytochrome family protein
MLLASGPRLHAGQHPVPLEPNTDAAKCLECHEDKAKGAHVHTAVTLGCTSCHEIRVTKNVTRIKLITTTSGKLCLTCHADKNTADSQGRVHPPAVRDCVKCHDPHQSANGKQLLKPVSGGKEENLCLSCHTTGLNAPPKGSRHAALDLGCDSCHTVHKTGDPNKLEFAYHLAKATPQLCLDCHDAKDTSLQKAHDNQPFASADCVQCHDPHQSSRPKLMQAFVHAPFEGGKSACDTCHQPVKDNKVVLTQASVKELCVTCHSDQAEQIEKAKVQHPGAAGDCTDCHNPHAGKSPGFPKPDAVNVCLSCHSEQAELRKKKHPHQPAFEQGCATCHTPHGSDNAHLLRTATTNALCLECHGPDVNPKKLEGDHLIALFGGAVRLPEDYFTRVPVLPLRYNAGHPVDRHPVSDAMDLKTKTMVPITCLTCHQPHAGSSAGMLVKDQEPDMAFCKNCHKEGTLQALRAK